MIARRKSVTGGIIENLVVPTDALATPFNNAELLYDLKAHVPYPGTDIRDPYPNINDLSHAQTITASVFASGILFVLGNFIIQSYRKIRHKKGLSLYSFFEKYSDIGVYLKTQAKDNDNYPPEILQAIAYYYNPDLPAFVSWRRRSWVWIIQSRRYLSVQGYKKITLFLISISI